MAGPSACVSRRIVRETSFMAPPRSIWARSGPAERGAKGKAILAAPRSVAARANDYMEVTNTFRNSEILMGLLVDGAWQDVDMRTQSGQFVRKPTVFHNYVTADGDPGPTGTGGFAAERGRYHLYVSFACPWAHRTLIFRKLKGLESLIGVSVVHWLLGDDGWTFAPGPGVLPDSVNGAEKLYELYVRAKSDYTGRVTVPVLWDKQRRTIV